MRAFFHLAFITTTASSDYNGRRRGRSVGTSGDLLPRLGWLIFFAFYAVAVAIPHRNTSPQLSSCNPCHRRCRPSASLRARLRRAATPLRTNVLALRCTSSRLHCRTTYSLAPSPPPPNPWQPPPQPKRKPPSVEIAIAQHRCKHV